MSLTRDYKETIQARMERDPAFREELLKEGIDCLLSGDVDTGKAVLRDYINATIGFQGLGGLTDKSPKSLMRMFGPNGNPQARNLFEIIGCLQKREGLTSESMRCASLDVPVPVQYGRWTGGPHSPSSGHQAHVSNPLCRRTLSAFHSSSGWA